MLLDGLVGMDDLCCGRVNNWDGLMEGRGVDNGDRTLVDNSGCVGQRNAGSVVDNGRGTSVVGQGIGACYGQNGSENELECKFHQYSTTKIIFFKKNS
jgi:hypothetical protein